MFQTRLQEMKKKFFNLQVFEFLINVLLLVTTYIFTSEMIYEYWEGNTNFSITEKSIEVEDFPTLTICLELNRSEEFDNWVNEHFKPFLKYGRDFTIQAMNSSAFAWGYIDNTAMITLVEGQNEIAFASQRRQILLQELVVYQSLPHIVRSCVRMVIKMEKNQLNYVKYVEGSSLGIGIFTVTLSQKTSVNIKGAYFYVTSERNSYGATIGQWYNGKVKPF